MTGILRVAKESIFSGLNNLVVNSVLDKKYSEYFGFTKPEVEAMAAYYQAEDKLPELCAWYDGYRFGETEIFNPWSVINYFNNACEARAYWVSTSGNDIIGEVLDHADSTVLIRWQNCCRENQFSPMWIPALFILKSRIILRQFTVSYWFQVI